MLELLVVANLCVCCFALFDDVVLRALVLFVVRWCCCRVRSLMVVACVVVDLLFCVVCGLLRLALWIDVVGVCCGFRVLSLSFVVCWLLFAVLCLVVSCCCCMLCVVVGSCFVAVVCFCLVSLWMCVLFACFVFCCLFLFVCCLFVSCS